MVGGCIEYLSMFLGLRVLGLVALAIYVAVFAVLKLRWKPDPIWNRRLMMGALAAGVAGMAILVSLAARNSNTDDATAQAERRWIRANRIVDLRSKLREFGSEADPADVAQTCEDVERIGSDSLRADERNQCGQAHMRLARDLLANRKIEEARRAFDKGRLELSAKTR
jgi:hypothetical protein